MPPEIRLNIFVLESIHTYLSGLYVPKGGSGGIGAPSLSKSQCETGT